MIPPGFIAKLINYYTSQPQFYPDLDRAIMTFFDVPSLDDLSLDSFPIATEGLLNEWLIFHFQFSDGRTPLQHWVEENPLRISQSTLHDYKTMLDSNIYSFFEVVSSQPGYSIIVRDIFTDQTYEVLEKTASRQAQSGIILPVRLGEYRQYWYIISADTVQFPTRSDERVKKYIQSYSSNQGLTPKDILPLIFQKTDAVPVVNSDHLDRKHVEETMQELLEEFDIVNMVTVQLIQDWIYEESSDNPPARIVNVLFSLVDREQFSPEQFDRLMYGLQNLYNVSPHAALSGQSPQERMRDLQQGEQPYKPNFVASITPIGDDDWLDHYDQAMDRLHQGQYAKSVKEFKQVFRSMLTNRSTEREIYRVFANAATAHFANAQVAAGKALLEYALELNPNYDFAQELMQKYEAKTLPIPSSQYPGIKDTKDPLARHPAKAYMNWLRYLGINFTTKKRTKTPKFVMEP